MRARGPYIEQRSQGRLLSVLLIGVAVLAAVLFTVKTRAMQAKSQVRTLEHQLAQERAQVQMLTAELAHLQSPARLSKLAAEHLGLEPVKAEKIVSLGEAAQSVPKREDSP
jgi:cell division protein FtsL